MNFLLPQNLSCVITTNTDINTTKLDNIVNVIWYQYNGTRNDVPLFSNNYRVHSTTSVGTRMFESKIEFVQVRASMAGQYQCRTWIAEVFHRNARDSIDVSVKCKYKIKHQVTRIIIPKLIFLINLKYLNLQILLTFFHSF